MKSKMSMSNESFKFLKNSTDFLNIILNSITSCVLLLDKEMKLHAFNPVLKTIFSNKKNENLMYVKCGEAIGCAYQVEEKKDCGTTSKCKNCQLRISALTSYLDDTPIYKEKITRPFYNANGVKENKHLNFSTRTFINNNEKYIFLMIEDVTEFMNLKYQRQQLN